jgi:hypothetical protein
MLNEIAVRTLPAANRVIRSIELKEVSVNSKEITWRSPDQRQALVIVLESGWSLVLVDACGQCCCEERYMSTEDDLESLVGETLMGIRHGGTSEKEADYGVVEAEFVHIQTDRDSVCIGTYNENNGYYGGLDLVVTILDPEGNVVVYQKSLTGED